MLQVITKILKDNCEIIEQIKENDEWMSFRVLFKNTTLNIKYNLGSKFIKCKTPQVKGLAKYFEDIINQKIKIIIINDYGTFNIPRQKTNDQNWREKIKNEKICDLIESCADELIEDYDDGMGGRIGFIVKFNGQKLEVEYQRGQDFVCVIQSNRNTQEYENKVNEAIKALWLNL